MNRVIVILNERSGAVREMGPPQFIDRIETGLRQRRVETEIRPVHGGQAAAAAQDASKEPCDAIVAAGGDGTISAVASVLAGSSLPLGVLPVGTLNHFARDLQVPLDLEESLDLIAHGNPQPVDVAQVNGRHYLNTSLVGTYPQLVAERDSIPTRTRRSKQFALMVALTRVLRRPRSLRVQVDADGELVKHRTPFVFVGNNVYSLELFTHEQRSCLDAGTLSVFSLRCSGFRCWLRLAWCGLKNGLRESPDLVCRTAKQVTLTFDTPTVQVAIDGELLRLQNPLHHKICPGTLRVICPTART